MTTRDLNTYCDEYLDNLNAYISMKIDYENSIIELGMEMRDAEKRLEYLRKANYYEYVGYGEGYTLRMKVRNLEIRINDIQYMIYTKCASFNTYLKKLDK